MNLKTTCIYVSTAVALCASNATSPVNANADTPLVSAFTGGGQAPPNPAGGSGAFAVRVAGNIPQASAEALKTELINEGYTGADAQPAGNGNYEVVLPNLASRAQADALMTELKSSGYTPDSIIEGSGGTASAAAPALTGDSVFRVLVAEFGSAEEATEASKVLVDDGFVNVDVVPENGKHKLMLGTFNRQADAEALLSDVNRAGFALASVVNRERLRASDAAAVADADLSGLSDTEQQRTRDVLAMAEKVESGEASADEIKQLRESIQQLSENQKAILGRQESNRSADREKLQRVFQLYREFDQALKSRDFTAAEKALAEVKQIDPNDMFLANRLQVLEQARSGGSTSAAPAGAQAAVDPAQVQKLLNEARAAENSGNSAEAAGKYRQVLALDPTNVQARSNLSDLEVPAPGEPAEQASGSAGLLENKPLVYGGAGLLAFIIILLLWMKSRKGKTEAAEPATMAGGTSFSMESSSIDPLGGTGVTTPPPTINSTPATGSMLAGAGMAGFATMHAGDDEEEAEPEQMPAPPAPAPVEESDTVSFEEFQGTPSAASPPAVAPDDDMVSLNLGDELVNEASEEPPVSAPAGTGSSMDADLESLLKGTFQGASSENESPITDAVAASAAAGAASPAEPTVVFQQSFDNMAAGDAPEDWRGEFDYATLSVANLGEAGHEQALKYEKPEGAGSATYHLSFPPAKGRVIAEFDIRCDEKNKFLLGVYLERDEDFKQSIHTIVHQLDPNAPASLRIQGEAAPYQMGTWSRIRYEADLDNGTLDCYLDNEHIVRGIQLPVAPEYVNTLSIRDNLATTGTMYLDNIRISEA